MKAGIISLRILMKTCVVLVLAFPAVSISPQQLEGPGSGLIARWGFDEGGGSSVYDSSGNANNGILIGSPVWTTGPLGGAISFNGTTDFIRIPQGSTLGLGIKTIAAWANLSDFIKSSGSFYGWGRGGCQDNYRGWVNYDGSFNVSYQNSPGETVIRPGTPIAPSGTGKLGEWAHYAFVYNVSGSAVTISLYKNGILAGTPYTGGDGLSNCGGITAIGSQEDLPNPNYIRTISGIFDDYRVYNRALSASDILALYNQGRVLSTDSSSPSTPSGVSATAISASQIRVSWNASADNVGVAGYVIYRNGSPLATVRSGTTYSDTAHSPATMYHYTIAPSSSYTYTVSAFDSAGNYSAQSGGASATTPAATPGATYILSVTLSGSGLSTVSSSPSGINCTSGTCSAAFSEGTSVVLTPYPFIMGMWASTPLFSGWSGGGCSGIGECMVTMNSDTAVIATYGGAPPTDTSPPVVTSFAIPERLSSPTVPITSFTASDNVGVTGYIVTESGTAPVASNPGWTVSAPGSYTFASYGSKTLYAWAKDAAGNVSTSRSATTSLAVISAPQNLRVVKK